MRKHDPLAIAGFFGYISRQTVYQGNSISPLSPSSTKH